MKAFTDTEQSKKLAEILPFESADMYYACGAVAPNIMTSCKQDYKCYTMCWSLAALLDVLPEGIIKNYYVPNLQKENSKYSIAYGNDELLCIADNPVDVCCELILKLHEQKLL